MNGQGGTWSTWREGVSVVVAPKNLRRTVSIALIIGSVFFAMNQLGTIVAGQATALVWLKAAMTYLTPLVVSNFGVLSATHRCPEPFSAAPTAGEEALEAAMTSSRGAVKPTTSLVSEG